MNVSRKLHFFFLIGKRVKCLYKITLWIWVIKKKNQVSLFWDEWWRKKKYNWLIFILHLQYAVVNPFHTLTHLIFTAAVDTTYYSSRLQMKLTIQQLLFMGKVTQIRITFWDLISVLLNILYYSQVMKKMTCPFLQGPQLENDWRGWNSQPWRKKSHYFTVFYSLG